MVGLSFEIQEIQHKQSELLQKDSHEGDNHGDGKDETAQILDPSIIDMYSYVYCYIGMFTGLYSHYFIFNYYTLRCVYFIRDTSNKLILFHS